MIIYIIRHADPDYEHDSITEYGHEQARALAPRMVKEKLDHIYTSPMGRAQVTASYTAEATGLKPTIEDWMAELNCRVTVEPWGSVAAWDVPSELTRAAKEYVDPYPWALGHWWDGTTIQKQLDHVAISSDKFLADHGYVREGERYRATSGMSRERVAIFCHNGSGLALLSHLLEIPPVLIWSNFWMSPTSVTTVLMEHRSEEWAVPRALAVNDTSHLYAAGLPLQPHGSYALNWP
jgi:probable phosphoglycerate mutase